MTQPKEKGGVPPIEIYTIVGKGVDESDPTKDQDAKHEDEEFQRILDEQQYRQKELEKVRNLVVWPGY